MLNAPEIPGEDPQSSRKRSTNTGHEKKKSKKKKKYKRKGAEVLSFRGGKKGKRP